MQSRPVNIDLNRSARSGAAGFTDGQISDRNFSLDKMGGRAVDASARF